MPHRCRIRVAVVAALVASAVLVGCTREPASPAAALFANEPFFIRGAVTEIGQPWGALVTGEPGTSYKIDKAYFRLLPATELIRADGTAATVDDITVGTRIRLWITGPILESYPVQVSAQRVLIE